ncbi:serine/arginine-rich splicing factor SR45a-like [Iris pallida]|uniref:Serine/arginine-rich splicing factor SR45a-like n=1 Tax=Iris pallida TaxID=29817 RepID=A0AAX6DML4_IRIPA|nr:serine/arginine-rich splicing factor SR45a-like [Iris pallida]KAJ6817561.1 serine/arginine-rich splicing factor SR45a-like [Iris pallida]
MLPLKEVRYTSRSITPPPKRHSRSRSPHRLRARSRSRSQDSGHASNPGNNLYITGLSTRVTSSDLEEYFSKEGKVRECELVLDPRSRESRGFAFVTMETVEDADRCVKHLNRSVLEGRLITVEKAKRKCGRTPTPGYYYGSRERRDGGRRRSRSHSPYRSREREDSNSRSRRPHAKDSDRRRRERGKERSSSAASDGNRRSD